MQSLGGGRMADVLAIDDDRVVKLDKPEYRGVSHFEADILRALQGLALPVPWVGDLVEIDGRTGFEMERLHGPTLTHLVERTSDHDALAAAFVDVHLTINRVSTDLGDLRARLASEIEVGGVGGELADGLRRRASDLPSPAGICHFDFHPDNVVVTAAGWRVVDWLGAAQGPTHADFARTLLLRADTGSEPMRSFMDRVRTAGAEARGVPDAELRDWVRVVAAARLAEGFDGPYGDWLTAVAAGDVQVVRD